MDIHELFLVALMPVLKTLLIALLGLFLALDRVRVLVGDARHHLNNLVFYVFFPSLLASNLVNSITPSIILTLWFIPVSVLITYGIGSAFGYALSKITRTPKHLEGLVICCCAAGNMGNLPVIIIPAICAEKNNPFGESDLCKKNGMAYVSLSAAIGGVFVWSIAYNIISAYGVYVPKTDVDSSIRKIESGETPEMISNGNTEPLLSKSPDSEDQPETLFGKIKRMIKALAGTILSILIRPPTIASIIGIIIGVTPIRKIVAGDSAPLRVIENAVILLGEAAVPCMTLIMGANLLKGMRSSGVRVSLLIGMVVVRFILMPLCGLAVVKGARHLGIVGTDPLYHFVLLLQYSVPPAMSLGTITQLFGIGATESSVITFWLYAAAGIALTLWSTYFMWFLN